MEPADAADLHAVLGDPETMAHYPEPWSLETVRRIINKSRELHDAHGIGWLAMLERGSERVIGDCGISFQNIDGEAEFEIGYHVHRDCWGRGFATEAARAVKRHGFEELRLRKLCSYMAEDHLASRRVAEKNGMTVEKTYRNPRNRDLPTVVYSARR